MKILTGRLKGRNILFKENPYLRPTSDKARKAVFDMLQGALEGRSVLDLFSGTGALGLEALSQGATHVTFVESDRAQSKRIQENLARLDLAGSATVCQDDVLGWLDGGNGPFDLIFMDPPYDTDLAVKALKKIERCGVLAKGGFVVVEGRYTEDVPEECGSLKTVRRKLYGQTKMTVYATNPVS